MISPLAAGFLSFLVDGQASLLVAGSRGSGKTSLLSALMLEIPQRFRILTIEDTAEIPVSHLQKTGYKIQSLITKSMSSGSGSTEIDPTDALRTALRLGESVLILGEVRGVEAKVLFEAMRVGAAGNLIMGTIHGSTTRDVYERIVYDIGVPATSFKAVDAVLIAAPIRSEGGIERKRRVTQISEITKTGWTTNPDPDGIFQDIMNYNTTEDELISTDLLDMGQSQVIRGIAKKWGITVEKALQNIKLRTEIKQTIVDYSNENKELLEVLTTRDANNAFWMLIEENKIRNKEVDYQEVRKKWMKWFNAYVGRKTT
jgi:GTPase SAR1 family protein